MTARSVRHEEKVRVSQGREPLLKCGQVQGSRACAKMVSAAGGAGSSGGTGGGARGPGRLAGRAGSGTAQGGGPGGCGSGPGAAPGSSAASGAAACLSSRSVETLSVQWC